MYAYTCSKSKLKNYEGLIIFIFFCQGRFNYLNMISDGFVTLSVSNLK